VPDRRRAQLRLVALASLIVALPALLTLAFDISPDDVREWVEGLGLVAPLAFIVISALLTVCLTPGPLLAAASGLLFGAALCTPVSIASATLGAALAFAIARTVGHDAVESLQGRRLARVRGWVGDRGFLSVLYARLAPGIPYTLFNYAAGLAPIRPVAFIAGTALGCAPRAYAYTALGGSWGDLGSPEAIVAIVLLVVISVAGLVLARRGRTPLRASGSAPGS
jgi:uncharacterized membrane protein YdjX (TVP38/TMEM64 family)